jgi:hypothetical protein
MTAHAYDALNRRISTTDATGTPYYHYDSPNVIAETDGAGHTTASYAYSAGGQLHSMTRDGQAAHSDFRIEPRRDPLWHHPEFRGRTLMETSPKFSKPFFSRAVRSDAGFSVEFPGRTGLRYVEGAKSASVDSEFAAVPNKIMIARSSIVRRDPPNEADSLDENDRERIFTNIRRAFEFLGYSVIVR